MTNYMKELIDRSDMLRKLIQEKTKENQKLPQANIRVDRKGKYFQYYLKEGSYNGKYIPAAEHKQVAKYLQQDYNAKVIRSAKEELKRVEALIKQVNSNNPNEIYSRLPLGKQVMVVPFEETDEQFIDKYKSIESSKEAFRESGQIYSNCNGEEVRSKSEVIISNMLDRLHIPYVYEMPLKLMNVTVHPDFTLINAEKRRVIYYEHFGMLDDEEYLRKTLFKIQQYEESGLYLGRDLIITGETSTQPLNIKLAERIILAAYNQ